jgi:hypothetical protein
MPWFPRGPFHISVEPGPVNGTLKQNGHAVERWEDLDLGQPWFWAPPNTESVSNEPYQWPEGWKDIGATVVD